MSQKSIEQRLQRLEASQAIQNLIGRYATAADQRNDAYLMTQLYHPNAIWRAKGFGEYQGREQITQALSAIAQEQVLWSLHVMAQPDIFINEACTQATARWVLWELSTLGQPNQIQQDAFLGGFYQSTLSPNEHGEWRFDVVELNLTLNSPCFQPLQKINA